jgi:hypothetical protein
MISAQLLAYVTATVDQELLLRNEYLAAENRILKAQIKGRLLLSQEEKATLAEIAHRLGRKALEEVAGAAADYDGRRPRVRSHPGQWSEMMPATIALEIVEVRRREARARRVDLDAR